MATVKISTQLTKENKETDNKQLNAQNLERNLFSLFFVLLFSRFFIFIFLLYDIFISRKYSTCPQPQIGYC